MSTLSKDVKYALRRLRSAWAFTLFSVATLALGIGATIAVYSIIDAVLLRPPAIPDADRVANLYHSDPRLASGGTAITLSTTDYEEYRARQTRSLDS